MEFRCAGITSGTCNGIGISLEVWFQGCTRGCAGCHNPELQDPTKGFLCDTDTILQHLDDYHDFYNSVVYLGGDACDQPKALYSMAANSNLPNILYTGWLFEDIPIHVKSVMDVIVDGPYIRELRTGNFPASRNQRCFIHGILVNGDFRNSINVII